MKCKNKQNVRETIDIKIRAMGISEFKIASIQLQTEMLQCTEIIAHK